MRRLVVFALAATLLAGGYSFASEVNQGIDSESGVIAHHWGGRRHGGGGWGRGRGRGHGGYYNHGYYDQGQSDQGYYEGGCWYGR